MAGGQLERRLGRCGIPARDHDPRDAGAARPLEDGLEIGLERRVLEVAMRVDDAGQAHRRTAAAQGAGTSSGSSTRGKIGCGAPVRRGPGSPSQASRRASPGPPAPRSS